WLARILGSGNDIATFAQPLGAWRWIALPVAVLGLVGVLALRRHRPFEPLELGAVILVALAAGPVSWDHYPSWAVVTVVLLADPRWWESRRHVEIAVSATLAAAAWV